MDEQHVYVIKKSDPKLSIDEAAEKSHQYFKDLFNERWARYTKEKKEAAKVKLFTDDGRVNIKPEERPKDMKAARKAMHDFFSKMEQ